MTHTIELEKWVEEIVKRSVAEHLALCPVRDRVDRMEVKFSQLVGFMLGSGVLGGGTGVILLKMIGS